MAAAEVTAAVSLGPGGVTAPPTTFNPITSKRGRDEADDYMAVDDLGSPLLKKPRKTRKLKQLMRSHAEPAPPTNLIAVPTSSSLPRSDPALSHTITGPPIGATCHTRNKGELPSTVLITGCTLEALQERFTKAQYDIAELEESLRQQATRHAQEKLHLKQEMLFDMIRRHEHNSQAMNKLLREKHYLSQYANEQKAESEKQKKKAEEERTKHSKAVVELSYCKTEVEHLQTLNKVMEEDLDELRQIENEDAAQRHRKAQGLPPAYGSLDDEDQFPTPQLHEDSGSFDVAVFKRTIRADFMRKLKAAQTETEGGGCNPNGASIGIFYVTSFALSDACRSLRTALDHAENAFSINMNIKAKKAPPDSLETRQHQHSAKRHIARREFVADRVAKTILDLGWRVISASELRPCAPRYERHEKARMNLVYKEVDECLLEALRQTFTLNQSGTGKDSLLWEYQHYYTQISALRRAFSNLYTDISYSFFSKAHEWLGEQVETERMHRANRSPNEQDQEGERPEWITGGSEVSSEAVRTGNESGAESD